MPHTPTPPTRRLTVRSAGVDLAVREHGTPSRQHPSLVLVHGYPDQQDVWAPVVDRLRDEDFHVVTYDVRGAGASGVPADPDGYRTTELVADLAAVVEATVPSGTPVHLVGHDWGSVQLWDAVDPQRTDSRLAGRLASYTSISGPSLDQVARRFREGRRHPRMLRQAARSWYVYAFQLPVLPEVAWRRGHRFAARALRRLEGLPTAHWGEELAANAVHGLNLYRANVLPRMRRPGRLRTDVPVLVIQPRHDHYVGEALLDGLEESCPHLRVHRLDAGHWVVLTHPDEVAALVGEHVRSHPGPATAERG